MIRNFFVVSFRNLLRYRTFTIINLIGLSLGITCALFIFLLVRFEQSYDTFHAKANRIYRINSGSAQDPDSSHDTGSPTGLAPILRDEFTEFENVGVILKLNPDRTQIEANDVKAREKQIFFADHELFNIFDFRFIEGNQETALVNPNEVVVTQSIAKKYFQGSAVGKSIRLNNESDLVITGVLADHPMNSDFPMDIIVSHATLERGSNFDSKELMGSNSYYQTYVVLKENVDPASVSSRFKKMVEQHLPPEQAKFRAFSLIALKDIHFISGNFNDRLMSRTAITALEVIGIFILVVACINFTNLANAQATKRGKEVGIRKSLGSSRKSLMIQFMGETFIVVTGAVIVAYAVAGQLAILSKNITEIPLSADGLSEPTTLLFIGLLLVGVTVLSGFYPAFILSGFRPIVALKSNVVQTGSSGMLLRKSLIAFQFIISQVLIICTLVVIRQTDYFNSMPLGFNKDAVVTVDLPNADPVTLSTLRNNLLQFPEIKNVSYSLNTPAATINKWWGGLEHPNFAGEQRGVEVKLIDSAYFNMFEIKGIAGTLKIEGDSGKNVVVNEALVNAIGISDPERAIGEKIKYWGYDATIVGVVKDFQSVTLHQLQHPVVLTRLPSYLQKASVKIDMAAAPQAIAYVEKYWKEAYPGSFFSYAFLDEDIASFYKEERKISKLLASFAFIAVGIGCIGLFGLIMFVAAQRTKEIGIRKILGASVANILRLLSVDFVKLVIIAGLVACPIGYYAMSKWLESFPNKIDLVANTWIFLLSTAAALVLALITVAFQSAKAATANPTDSLRSE